MKNIFKSEIAESSRFLVGFIGQGPALKAFSRLVNLEDFLLAFPRAKVAGWVPTPGTLPDIQTLGAPEFLHKRPLFSSISRLFSFYPGMHLVVDLSPDSRHIKSMRAHAPKTVSLCGSELLLRFCAAVSDSRLIVGGGENLRKRQKLFGLIVDQIDGDIMVLDQNGVILDINQYGAETRGMTRSQIIGKRCSELDPGNPVCRSQEDSCPFRASQKTGKDAQHTFSMVMPSGRLRYIRSTCLPVTNAAGSSVQYLFIRRDVTEKQALEQRLQQAEKMAAIGELSTYMAHEIRNPLFSIGGFANALLRNPSLNDLAREKARIIYDESRRLDVILTNILNFARPIEQTMSEFDSAIVARQTIDLMTIGSDERGIKAVLEIEPNLPKASGNADNLKQCLINMVKNALEAMPGGGTLTLRVKHNNGYIKIEVEDTGRGIPAELQENIFSPFFTTKNKGAGLGLAMTRKIMGEMGGTVLLESQENKGTLIALFVPVALAVEEESKHSAEGKTG